MKKYRGLIVILVAIFAIGALVACGSTTPAEQVEEAAEQVDEAVDEAEEAADEAVDEAEEAVEEAAEEVEEAMEEAGAGLGMDAAMVAEQFFSQEDLEDSIRWMDADARRPRGPTVVTVPGTEFHRYVRVCKGRTLYVLFLQCGRK